MSREAGLASSTLSNTLTRPWPKGEWLIAIALDWHPADIVAALHKRGTSLAKLSREAGLASSTLSNTLTRPWPKGEWLIAIALD
ncbi:helix-turn-helix domain-containing protein, partial [Salmonella enterica subsp. enterica serovar Agona]